MIPAGGRSSTEFMGRLNADDRGDARLSGHQPSPNRGIFVRPGLRLVEAQVAVIKRLGFARVAEQKTPVNSLREA